MSATGGFVLDWHGLHLSARSAARPAELTLAALVLWALADVGDTFRRAGRLLRRVGRSRLMTARPPYRTAAAILAVAIAALGWTRGSMAAGGADPYGYVSQARLWAAGALRVDQPLARELPWSNAADTVTPLGYRPTPDGAAAVPTYSPGLPILMAIFDRLAGASAVYRVVPLLGGLAVFATFLLGRQLAGDAAGLAAAVLLATSPVFVYWLMWPMSDVPVAAWWTLALVLASFEGPATALAGGLAAGLAILTRPNLVVLGVMPGAWLIWRAATAVRQRRRAAIARAVLFAAGALPFCLGIALLFRAWYGSPFESGYGTLDALFAWKNLAANLSRYPVWLVGAETPLVLLGLAAPLLRLRRLRDRGLAWVLLAFALANFAAYLFYTPFVEWWYLRFVLPAFPPLLVLTAAVLIELADRVPAPARRAAVAAVLVAWGSTACAIRTSTTCGKASGSTWPSASTWRTICPITPSCSRCSTAGTCASTPGGRSRASTCCPRGASTRSSTASASSATSRIWSPRRGRSPASARAFPTPPSARSTGLRSRPTRTAR